MTASNQMWRKAILQQNSSIRDAIECLNKTAIKIVLVVNENGTLDGTVSDGDIRRGLLRGLNLDQTIENVIHRNSLAVSPNVERNKIIELMTESKVHQIPIINKRGQLVGLHLWDEVSQPLSRTNTVVIMAGGKGLRLRPHTQHCPKPLIQISGKPILEHIINRAKSDGFQHFVIAIHYLGDMIKDYFGNGSKFGVEIEYLCEPTPLGTAGALSLFHPKSDESFVVTNGDVISDINYGKLLDFHRINNAMGTMAVRFHEWHHPFGVVQTDGIEIVGFEEKPVSRTQINAGVYALRPEILNKLSDNQHCHMPNLFEKIQKNGLRVLAYPMYEPWIDIGNPDDLKIANQSVVEIDIK